MKLNGIGPSWPRAEPAPHDHPIAGPAGSARLVVPAEIDPGRQAGWNGVDAPPVPLRFPWLSRQTQVTLEAAGQRAGFDPLPVLGDKLDTWT